MIIGNILAFSQQSKIDSLLFSVKHAQEDTDRVNSLNTLSFIIRSHNPDSAIILAKQSIELSENIGFENGISKGYEKLGIIYCEQHNYSESLNSFFSALKIDEALKDKRSFAKHIGNIGTVYKIQGNYIKASEYYFQSLKISEEIKDKAIIAANLGNLGTIHRAMEDYDQALEYYIKALGIFESLDNKHEIATCLANIGVVYYFKKSYKYALDYYFRALKIDEDLANQYAISKHFTNIGIVYMEKSDYEKALNYYFKAFEINKKIDNYSGMASNYGSIGLCYMWQKKYGSARIYLDKALLFSKETGEKEKIEKSYNSLALLDSAQGNYLSSYENYKMYILYRDSLINEENTKKTVQAQMQYEFDKKEESSRLEQEKKDAIAASELKRERIIRYSTLSGLILVLAFAAFIIQRWKQSQKQKRIIEIQKREVDQRNLELAEQKNIVESQKQQIELKNKDLTDSIHYAQRIQSSILTSEEYLENMFLSKGPDSSYFVLYKPKDIVAGDFYWAYQTPDNKLIWMVADCTGHGVPGAFMSFIGNSLLNEIVVEKKIYEPHEILENMRSGIIKALGQSGGDKKRDGMDACLCCWDKTTNKLTFAGANNPLWIIKNNSTGEIIELESDSQPVGHHAETMMPFTKKEFQLEKGDMLYSATDGFADQFGGCKGKKFKSKPFQTLLLSICHRPMQEQKEILNEVIVNWKGDLEQTDDICVMGVRI